MGAVSAVQHNQPRPHAASWRRGRAAGMEWSLRRRGRARTATRQRRARRDRRVHDFTLERVGGAGELRSGDALALKASTGKYVSAQAGGGGAVNADGPRLDAWETLTVTIFRPQLVRLRSAVAAARDTRYVTAEGGTAGAVTVNRTEPALWETFALFNLSRPDGTIRSGDTVGLQAWGATSCGANQRAPTLASSSARPAQVRGRSTTGTPCACDRRRQGGRSRTVPATSSGPRARQQTRRRSRSSSPIARRSAPAGCLTGRGLPVGRSRARHLGSCKNPTSWCCMCSTRRDRR